MRCDAAAAITAITCRFLAKKIRESLATDKHAKSWTTHERCTERERRRERELESVTCVSAKTGQLQHQQQQQQQLHFGPGRLHSHTSNIFCRCPRSYAKPSCCCCCCCSNVAVVLRDSSRQQNCAIFPMKTKAGKVRQRRPTAADPHWPTSSGPMAKWKMSTNLRSCCWSYCCCCCCCCILVAAFAAGRWDEKPFSWNCVLSSCGIWHLKDWRLQTADCTGEEQEERSPKIGTRCIL